MVLKINYFVELFPYSLSEFINYIASSDILTALSIFCSVMGITLIGVIRKCLTLMRKNDEQLKTSAALAADVAQKSADIMRLHSELQQRDAQLRLFESMFPKSKNDLHILFHELHEAELSSSELKKAAQTEAHIPEYDGYPLVRTFLRSVMHYIITPTLLAAEEYACARVLAAGYYFDRYVENCAALDCDDIASFPLRESQVLDDLDHIDTLQKLAWRHKDNNALDSIIGFKLLIAAHPKIPLQSSKRQEIGSSALATLEELLGRQVDSEDEAEREWRFSAFPRCSSVIAFARLMRGLPPDVIGISERILATLQNSDYSNHILNTELQIVFDEFSARTN